MPSPTIPPAPLDPAQLEPVPWRRSGPAGCCPATPTSTDGGAGVGTRASCSGAGMCVGRSADVAVGGLRAESVGDYGVLLTRDTDGVLRGVRERLPAPRPRAAAVRRLGRAARAIVCPYHAWTYRLDGSLIGAPGLQATSTSFDKSTLGLKPVRVQRVARLGLRRPDRARPPDFAEHIGELEDDRGAVRRRRHWSPPSPTSTTSRPTGRSSSRTTRSATTAR